MRQNPGTHPALASIGSARRQAEWTARICNELVPASRAAVGVQGKKDKLVFTIMSARTDWRRVVNKGTEFFSRGEWTVATESARCYRGGRWLRRAVGGRGWGPGVVGYSVVFR